MVEINQVDGSLSAHRRRESRGPRPGAMLVAVSVLVVTAGACSGSDTSDESVSPTGLPSSTISDADDGGSNADAAEPPPSIEDPGDVAPSDSLPPPIVVELPFVPILQLPDVSEATEISDRVEANLDQLIGAGVDVVTLSCDAEGAVQHPSSTAFSALAEGRLSVDGEQAVDITVNPDGSGMYFESGPDGTVEVKVEGSGAGTYRAADDGRTVDIEVRADGSGVFREVDGDTETLIELRPDGTGVLERQGVVSGDIALRVDVRTMGAGRLERRTDTATEIYERSDDGNVRYQWQNSETGEIRELLANVDGSGSYIDDSESVRVTVAPDLSATYRSPAGTIEFRAEMGILDPAIMSVGDGMVSVEQFPAFLTVGSFPPLDTLPSVEPPCATVIRLTESVLFDFDADVLRSSSASTLDEVTSVLDQVDLPIKIVGHTDALGEEAYNLDLSLRRAMAVQQGLVDRGLGVPMSAAGLGETQPIAPNTTPDGADDSVGRQLNRRVEIIIATPDR